MSIANSSKAIISFETNYYKPQPYCAISFIFIMGNFSTISRSQTNPVMIFNLFQPAPGLEKLIDCYWMISDESTDVQQKKIIPDGFSEIIFHHGDPYRNCLEGEWHLQSRRLLAGQISNHFYLENTGRSSITGIKLKPTAFTHLFDLPMHPYSNKVVDINTIPVKELNFLGDQLDVADAETERTDILDKYFIELLNKKTISTNAADHAVDLIFKEHGIISIAAICEQVGIGERQLENLFKKYVGLSPKLFARIIRFSYIFQLVQENNHSWCSLAYEAAYYDQSHFIRNFKNFTGENPADYAFDEKNMANFFLNKSKS